MLCTGRWAAIVSGKNHVHTFRLRDTLMMICFCNDLTRMLFPGVDIIGSLILLLKNLPRMNCFYYSVHPCVKVSGRPLRKCLKMLGTIHSTTAPSEQLLLWSKCFIPRPSWQEYLFDCGHSRMLDNQLSQLWEEEFAIMGRKKRPVSEVYESIVRDKIIDKKKYYLVKECDVVGMISRYSTALEHPCMFERRYKESYRGKLKNPCFGDLKEVIDKMEPSPRLKVDDYTRLLIKFARRDPVKYKEMLLTRVVEIVDTKALRRLNPYLLIFWHEEEPTFKDIDLALTHLMLNFFDDMKNELQEQLLTVVRPLLRLSDFLDLSASLYVFEIVEVAELRRCALGDRFISRNHLMWAFYECGYGLPPRITKTLNLNTADEDHPPYHIYWSSLKLAKSLGEKNMRLQHFVFAVLYSEDIFIDNKQVIEMQEHFKDFLKVVASDSLERPKVPCNSSEISYFKLLGHDMLISSEELKNALQSGKLDELVHECSSMMIS